VRHGHGAIVPPTSVAATILELAPPLLAQLPKEVRASHGQGAIPDASQARPWPPTGRGSSAGPAPLPPFRKSAMLGEGHPRRSSRGRLPQVLRDASYKVPRRRRPSPQPGAPRRGPLAGAQPALKDLDDALHPMPPPGPLAALAPATVTEFYALERPVRVAGPAGTGEAHVWAEWLEPISGSCEVLLRYDQAGGWLDGKVACATHALGAGRVTMLGAWLDGPLMSALLARLASRAGAIPAFGPPPPGVEFCRRVAQERRSREVLIALNHGEEGRTISPGWRGRDALTGASHERFELRRGASRWSSSSAERRSDPRVLSFGQGPFSRFAQASGRDFMAVGPTRSKTGSFRLRSAPPPRSSPRRYLGRSPRPEPRRQPRSPSH